MALQEKIQSEFPDLTEAQYEYARTAFKGKSDAQILSDQRLYKALQNKILERQGSSLSVSEPVSTAQIQTVEPTTQPTEVQSAEVPKAVPQGDRDWGEFDSNKIATLTQAEILEFTVWQKNQNDRLAALEVLANTLKEGVVLKAKNLKEQQDIFSATLEVERTQKAFDVQSENAKKLLDAGVAASNRSSQDQVDRMLETFKEIETTLKQTPTLGENLALQAKKQQMIMLNEANSIKNQTERAIPLMSLSGTESSAQTMGQESQAIEVESIPL